MSRRPLSPAQGREKRAWRVLNRNFLLAKGEGRKGTLLHTCLGLPVAMPKCLWASGICVATLLSTALRPLRSAPAGVSVCLIAGKLRRVAHPAASAEPASHTDAKQGPTVRAAARPSASSALRCVVRCHGCEDGLSAISRRPRATPRGPPLWGRRRRRQRSRGASVATARGRLHPPASALTAATRPKQPRILLSVIEG